MTSYSHFIVEVRYTTVDQTIFFRSKGVDAAHLRNSVQLARGQSSINMMRSRAAGEDIEEVA